MEFLITLVSMGVIPPYIIDSLVVTTDYSLVGLYSIYDIPVSKQL